MDGEQMMILRADIGDTQDGVAGKLALDGEVVLLGVLRFQVRLEFSGQQDGPELRPVDAAWRSTRRVGCAGRGRCLMKNSPIRIWEWRSTRLRFKGKIEKGIRQRGAATEGRLAAELLENELLNRIVKDSIARANARFPGPPVNFASQPLVAAGLQARPMRGAKAL